MVRKNDLKSYYRGVKQKLTCSPKSQRDFLAETRRMVGDYLENRPDASYEDIVRDVGEPKELAETFLGTLPNQCEVVTYYKKTVKRKRLIILTVVLVIAALCGIIFCIGQMQKSVVTEKTETIIYSATSGPLVESKTRTN